MVTDAASAAPPMPDQLYLSYWLNSFTPQNMLRHYEKLLALFPYSRLTKRESRVLIVAIGYQEQPILERAFKSPPDIGEVLAASREFLSPDCCYRLETEWDLWHFDGDWKVQPSPVALCCLGPDFEKDLGEHLRVEFGIDSHFLPRPELPNHAAMTQSNIRSLLKLVHDADNALNVSKRLLWTESGENFAEKLQEALSAATAK